MGRKKKEKDVSSEEDNAMEEEQEESPVKKSVRRASKPTVGKWATLGKSQKLSYISMFRTTC